MNGRGYSSQEDEQDEFARYGDDQDLLDNATSENDHRDQDRRDQDDQDDEFDDEPEEEERAGMNARSRKYLALKPPIASLCTALGGVEEFKDDQGQIYSAYSLGDQVVGCLKDLKRFWRMDEKDDDRTVARIFYDVGLLKNDLIPILLTTLGTGNKGDRIALACVELIGAMTWPIDVIAELQEAKNHDELKKAQDYTSLKEAQLTYKSLLLRNGGLRAMFQLMSPSLAKTRRDRTTKDENIISLILHTFRNLASLLDRPTTSQSSESIEFSTLQSVLLVQMQEEGIFDLLIAIAHNSASSEYSPWNMVVLDILHLVFRGVQPRELMVVSSKITENRLKDLLDLEGKHKKAAARLGNSRHSRFGTTVALQAGGQQYIIHKQSTISRGAEQTLDQIKKSKAKKYRQDDDLAPPSSLQPSAIKTLRSVALSFIDSAFNPFFASVLKDIRMERAKVKETDTVRFLYLARFFLEFFLLVYADEHERGIDPQSDEGHDFDLIAEMTETQSIQFVSQRMKTALEEKPIPRIDLHAGIDCFTQIVSHLSYPLPRSKGFVAEVRKRGSSTLTQLLIIEALSASGVPDHIDIAEILQNKLYYEAETLDMVLKVITNYNTQSHKYLDSVINLSYTLLRMLEKYSKSKAFMYVRKKKQRHNKKRKAKRDGDDEAELLGLGGNEEEDEVDRSVVSFKEHSFEFTKFEERFADEAVLQTCMTYLEAYKSFSDPDQLKRIVALMHRQAVKAKSEGLFFKPSVLELFQRILDDDAIRVARDQATMDLKKLVEYILKKFLKAVKEKPFLLIECFFPKTKTQLNKMRDGDADPYATSDDEAGFNYKFKIPGEVEVTPGFTLTQQIGIAVACLVDAGDLPLVRFVIHQLELASASRTEIVLMTDGVQAVSDVVDVDAEMQDSDEVIRRKAAAIKGPSTDAIAKFFDHELDYDEETKQREETTRNANLKLLMRLLSWESRENDDKTELIWFIPTSLLPSTLDGDKQVIENFLLDPVDPDGKSASDYLRKKRKPAKKRVRREDTPEYDDEGNVIEPVKKISKRSKKRIEEALAYKSAQFVEDSDDDEEADRAFFAREAELRNKLAAGEVATTSALGGTKATKKSTTNAKSKPKRDRSETVTRRSKKAKVAMKELDLSEVSDLDEEDMEVLLRAANKEKELKALNSKKDDSDDDQDDDDPSPSSGTLASKPSRSSSVTSNSTAGPRDMSPSSPQVSSDKRGRSIDSDGADSDVPAPTIVKKRKVILDSDDDE